MQYANYVTTEEAIHHLNDLTAVAHDGAEGYLNAAEHVNNMHFQTVFEEYAKQRTGFVHELQAEVRRLGGEPIDSGTLGASVHRGWLDLKSALTGGSAAAIVAACETGEDSAQAAYERVVNIDISGETRTLVEKQWHKIQEAHQRLINLKHEHHI